jgi:hypothetical protein
MTTTTEKPKVPEFKPFKKLSPFVADPFNSRGGKSAKGGVVASSGVKGGKQISVPKFKGGSGGDR